MKKLLLLLFLIGATIFSSCDDSDDVNVTGEMAYYASREYLQLLFPSSNLNVSPNYQFVKKTNKFFYVTGEMTVDKPYYYMVSMHYSGGKWNSSNRFWTFMDIAIKGTTDTLHYVTPNLKPIAK